MKERSAGQVVFGRYELLRPLAEGGMSSVWVALDRKLKREVALKLMSPIYAASERSRQRFELEAMSVARLHSPHVVQVFDYGVDHHAPFIVMELLAGEDLRRRLKRDKRLGAAAMARILAQTAAGLDEAHDAGLVHRDMKPGNLFLTRTRTGEIVKVLDFGVAKAASGEAVDEAEITEHGSMVGTPQYMSPEQIRCLPDIDARSDLFSLGVIVYRALTGELPFKGKTTSDLAVNICTSAFVPPSKLADLPTGIDDFMNLALAKKPSDRFPNASSMAEAFSLLLPDGAIGELPLDGPGSISSTSLSSSLSGRAAGSAEPSSSGTPAPSISGDLAASLSEISMGSLGGTSGEHSSTGASSIQTFSTMPGVNLSSSPPSSLPSSESGTLASTFLGEPRSVRPRSKGRTVLLALLVIAGLGAAGAVGTMFGSTTEPAPAPAASAAPPVARAAEEVDVPAEDVRAEVDVPAEEVDGNDETATDVPSAPSADPTSEPPAPAPRVKAGSRPKASPPPAKTPPPPPPPPKSNDDWDPFDARK